MRKVLLFTLLSFIFTLPVHSQLTIDNIVWQAEGSLSNPDDAEIETSWDVINATGETVRLRGARQIISVVSPFNLPYVAGNPGARDRFCWGEICFDYGTGQTPANNALLVTLEPGESTSTFKGLYEHMGVAGVSHFRYCFFDVDDTSIEICHEALYCIDADCAVNVQEMKEPVLTNMGPNPVQGRASFSYDFASLTGERSVVIYNMVGSIVRQFPINSAQGSVFISADEFDAGIYFYALMHNGVPVSTKKFVVSK